MSAHDQLGALELQPIAARVLHEALERGTNHAWLLTGEPGAGTLEAVAAIARATLCPAGTGSDGCDTCERVDRHVHPDLCWVKPEGFDLRVEQIHEVAARATRRPFEGHAQVIVLEDADSLDSTNAESGNALLKMLEEPPGNVVFVLLARRPARMLATLRSRSIEIRLPPLPDETIAAALAARPTTTTAPLDNATLVGWARGDLARALDLRAGGDAFERTTLARALSGALATGQRRPAEVARALAERCEAVGAQAEATAEAAIEAELERTPEKEAKRHRNDKSADGMAARVRRSGRRARVSELQALIDDMSAWYLDLMAIANGVTDHICRAGTTAELEPIAASPLGPRAVAAIDALEECALRARTNNADLNLLLPALCAELASLAEGRVRSRRTISGGARTPQGYDLALG
jgi:DNA polymerase-3 subunit delta'